MIDIKDKIPGVYRNEWSVFHSIKPGIKLISLVLFIVLIFLPLLKEFSYPYISIFLVHIIFLFLVLVVFFELTNISSSSIIHILSKIKILFLLTIIFRTFSYGKYSLTIPLIRLPMSLEGFIRGIFLFTQIFLVMLVCRLFTYSTSPDDVVKAIRKILIPFKGIKLPVDKIARIFATTLFLIPIVLKVTQEKIADFKVNREGSIFTRFHRLINKAIEYLVGLLKDLLKIDYSVIQNKLEIEQSPKIDVSLFKKYIRLIVLMIIFLISELIVMIYIIKDARWR